MKAAVLKGPDNLEVRNVPEPQPGPDEVKVKIAYCGICGTDPEIIEGRFVPPGVDRIDGEDPGHESSGTVVAVGERVSNFRVGQRVACNFRVRAAPAITAAAAWRTSARPRFRPRGGSPSIPYTGKAPSMPCRTTSVSRSGALLEPVSIAVHVVDIANVYPGSSVAVLGGGPIGLLSLQIALRARRRQDVAVRAGRREGSWRGSWARL